MPAPADADGVKLSMVLAIGWLAVWALVFVIFVARRVGRRAMLRSRYSAAAVPAGLGLPWRALAPFALVVAAGACLLMAVGQFRLDEAPTQGTVVLAIDVSDSMDATDVEPNRLEAAKDSATSFLSRLPGGFRVAVVTFAGSAQTLAEPGGDRNDAAEAIEGLGFSRGTVIGDGLTTSLDVIEADWQAAGVRPAAVILLSDGADTGSIVPPAEAAARASRLTVPVFTVAIVGDGSDKGSDTRLLQQIATSTGGGYETASTAGELSEVYDSLGTRLSTQLAVGGSVVLLLALAAVLAIGAIVLFLSTGRAMGPRRR